MTTAFEKVPNWGKSNVQWLRLRAWMRGRMGVEVTDEGGNIIKVKQTRFVSYKLYTQKELIKMGRDLYPDKRYKITPVTYPFDARSITPEWIREQMTRWDIRPKDLTHHLGLSASAISELINGGRPLSAPVSALFYYFFQVKRLGDELTNEITAEELREALEVVKRRRRGEDVATQEIAQGLTQETAGEATEERQT